MSAHNPKAKVILNSSSSGTGLAYFVGDARFISVSIQTSTASASRFTTQLSNADGMQTSIPEASWSIATVITGGAGLYSIDPGGRWLRMQQPDFSLSATSGNTVTLSRQYQQ
jgi:hypothetical protein